MSKKNGKKNAVAPEQVAEPVVEQATVSDTTPVAEETKANVLSVDFKAVYEESNGKKEVPKDVVFRSLNGKEINLHDAMSNAFKMALGEAEGFPVVVSRKRVLNNFCIANELTPAFSKRVNKTENKTETTYGQVPQFNDSFEVDGINYRLLGFLKWRMLRTDDFVAVKMGVHFLVMDVKTYDEKFVKGLILEDKDVNIIE